ncbi:MAG: DNA polymerase III subunit delta [Chloroflexi bacterium]|nr:DNA polymerase III subunit delta [Chloroflexota bacterium]MCL5109089.1 DNA polymerase III subunit delta [Chloroflexota bacterium]
MLYVLHGDDELRRSEWLAEIRNTVALDEGLAGLNTSVLDGQKLTAEELEAACGTAPFLADKRLVIVEGLVSRLEPKGEARKGTPPRAPREGQEKRLVAYLSQIPPTTDLVLAEERLLSPLNAFVVAAVEAGGRPVALSLPRPDSQELRQWLVTRARVHGAQLLSEAVEQLLAFGGNNLRLLDGELAKLAAYADGAPIGAEEVRRSVSYAREASVFDMVDALGRRDTRTALRKLHELLAEGEAAGYLFAMIARQITLLLRARELLDGGTPPASLAAELGVHRFVAQKIGDQARNFSAARLRALHEQLLQLDWASKTGKVEQEAALDVFVASVGMR